ncbi:Hypothetical protein PMM2029 [Prochlorococcus marinus subsp. pastoris str. CCMP1986]|uniref:Uncharacterized protein n=1 Tax=Prochlorococcus marinus subsp. pastoris (strain CCMP1986 / NIES-2087 / MED4) TaxID=59919 RepID=B9ER27_PROMP|nr:hypothetical protein PROCH_1856 [Prochlorococcus marinus str. EQPAC1]CAX37111.1 Hypothetical protein PMM2029 [Prochlorococcus marinus subsp. pastoris str. CCMP1986]
MNTFTNKYLFPIKLLPWIFWGIISVVSVYLFSNAWIS